MAPQDAPVLLLGESGTGKELVAGEIHRLSGRAGSLVPVHCASLPADFMDVELLGHKTARNGTIFLDEIGSMPLPQQESLLRALETRPIRRVETFRVVAATDVDLQRAMEEGHFCKDLFFRLSTAVITLPPLRERVEDIPLLAEHFADLYAAGWKRRKPAFSASALMALKRHTWPGNVRELQNVIQQAVLLSPGGTLDESHLQLGRQDAPVLLVRKLPDVERDHIVEALALTGGNKARVAALLGISRQTLYKKIEAFGIASPERVPWGSGGIR